VNDIAAYFFIADLVTLALSIGALMEARRERRHAENYRWEAENLFHIQEQFTEEDWHD
jgi:hypothetical protein